MKELMKIPHAAWIFHRMYHLPTKISKYKSKVFSFVDNSISNFPDSISLFFIRMNMLSLFELSLLIFCEVLEAGLKKLRKLSKYPKSF